MKDINMIVCDLDGTLLRTDKTISEYTLNMFEKCRKLGIKIGIATARSEMSILHIIDKVRPDVLITNGGAMCKYDGEIIYTAYLDAETTNAIVLRLLDEKDIGAIGLETNENYFVSQAEAAGQDYPQTAVYIDFSKEAFAPAQKITTKMPKEPAKNIAADFPGAAVMFFADERWVTFSCKNATKWQGVTAAARHLGIDKSNIAAFGDDYNDIEMLANCGLGVAMGNGIAEAKTAAKYCAVTNDEDGVARWINENII